MPINKTPETDLLGDDDIKLLVDSFYETIRNDDLLGPIFNDRVEDWSKHLPTMYAFWGTMLFGKKDYQGNPMAKHIDLPVERHHFARWVELFIETVDGLFVGAKAEHAKGAAKSIAHTFQIRMGIDPFGDSKSLI